MTGVRADGSVAIKAAMTASQAATNRMTAREADADAMMGMITDSAPGDDEGARGKGTGTNRSPCPLSGLGSICPAPSIHLSCEDEFPGEEVYGSEGAVVPGMSDRVHLHRDGGGGGFCLGPGNQAVFYRFRTGRGVGHPAGDRVVRLAGDADDVGGSPAEGPVLRRV